MIAKNVQLEPVLSLKQPARMKIRVTLEVLAVFALMIALRLALYSTRVVQWELENLGYSYLIPLLWIIITGLVILSTRRGWAAFGLSRRDWRTNLDIGIKAYLVRFIPIVVGTAGAVWLSLTGLVSVGYRILISFLALALMVWALNRQKEMESGLANVILSASLLFVPLGVALAMGQLSLVIVSTLVWQFVFSGFGEEFIYRGYIQSRLNQAFGRPLSLFGVQFGPGLLIASLLFGLLHASNIPDPSLLGLWTLDWEWALSSALGGLFLGVIREKTGTLLAALACRPVVTIGWSEILVLAVIILVLLGPFLWRLYRFWVDFQERNQGPGE